MFNYYNLNFPATYTLYNSETFRDFLMLETMDNDYLYDLLMTSWIGEDIDRYPDDSLVAYGLDMYIAEKGGINVTKNLFVMILVFAFLAPVSYILKQQKSAIQKCCCCSWLAMKIRNIIVYNTILRLMLETYMPICLATFLALQN